MRDIKGSCLCGSINYNGKTTPRYSALCHCVACQKTSGSAFSSVIGINKSDISFSGNTLNKYEDVGDSGNTIYRAFCSKCGSHLYGAMSTLPDMIMLKVSTLDDNSWVKPVMNTYWRDHCSWIGEISDLKTFDTMPYRNQG